MEFQATKQDVLAFPFFLLRDTQVIYFSRKFLFPMVLVAMRPRRDRL